MEQMIKQLRDTATSLASVSSSLTELGEQGEGTSKYDDVISALDEAVGYIHDAVKMAEKINT